MTEPARLHTARAVTLTSVAAIVGVEAAVRLSIELGGIEVHVAHHPRPDSPLVQAIGMDAAQKLAREMGGTYLDVPLGEGLRHLVVWLRFEQGLSHEQIARKVRRGVRYVYKVLAEHEQDPIIAEYARPMADENQLSFLD